MPYLVMQGKADFDTIRDALLSALGRSDRFAPPLYAPLPGLPGAGRILAAEIPAETRNVHNLRRHRGHITYTLTLSATLIESGNVTLVTVILSDKLAENDAVHMPETIFSQRDEARYVQRIQTALEGLGLTLVRSEPGSVPVRLHATPETATPLPESNADLL